MKTTKELAREMGLLRKRTLSNSSLQLRNAKRARVVGQPFKYLIVIDFEATCWEDKKFSANEIIEFPAVLLNTSTGEIEAEFHDYVQPQEKPVLSAFCKQLTGISQEQVDAGIPLHITLRRFSHWLDKLRREKEIVFPPNTQSPTQAAFVTWSDWDLGVCLLYECRRKQILKPRELNSWIDIRDTYRKFYDRKPNGLNGALQDLGIEFQGREHSGLDDAKNTAMLAWRMIRDGCQMNITKTLERPIKTTALDYVKASHKVFSEIITRNAALSPNKKMVDNGKSSLDAVDNMSDGSKAPINSIKNEEKNNKVEDEGERCKIMMSANTKTIAKSSKIPTPKKNAFGNVPSQARPLSNSALRDRKGNETSKMGTRGKNIDLNATFTVNQIYCDEGRDGITQSSEPITVKSSSAALKDTTNIQRSGSSANSVVMEKSKPKLNQDSTPHVACYDNSKSTSRIPVFGSSTPLTRNGSVGPTLNSVFKTPSRVICPVQGGKIGSSGFHTPVTSASGQSSPLYNGSIFKTPSPAFSSVKSGNSLSNASSFFKTPTNTSLSTMKPTPPMCKCGRRAKVRMVQSPGQNMGRFFFSCSRKNAGNSKGGAGCDFFKWESSGNTPQKSRCMGGSSFSNSFTKSASCLTKPFTPVLCAPKKIKSQSTLAPSQKKSLGVRVNATRPGIR